MKRITILYETTIRPRRVVVLCESPLILRHATWIEIAAAWLYERKHVINWRSGLVARKAIQKAMEEA